MSNVCLDYKCVAFNTPIFSTHNHEYKTVGSEGAQSYRIPISRRYDLIPPIILEQLAEVYEEGSKVYGDARYIENPLPYGVVINHLLNHLLLFNSGDRSELHLAKVMWGCATLIVYEDMIKEGLYPRDKMNINKYGANALEAVRKLLDNVSTE